MWGNILTEVSYIQNFNMGFSNNKADVLIHLTQWQYWWWFWFSFLWILYYLLIARVFRYRTLKFNPRIASTLRPHGKWGDLLTCIIPVTWCINILLNSNFILKLIEWQSESSLFTLRIRAKQWYWVYKLDLRNISDIYSAPRNIGRNKWQFATFGDLQTAEDYLHIIQMRAYNSWSKDFWSELGKKSIKKNKFNTSTSVDSYKDEFLKNINTTQVFNFLKQNNITSTITKNLHLYTDAENYFNNLNKKRNFCLFGDVNKSYLNNKTYKNSSLKLNFFFEQVPVKSDNINNNTIGGFLSNKFFNKEFFEKSNYTLNNLILLNGFGFSDKSITHNNDYLVGGGVESKIFKTSLWIKTQPILDQKNIYINNLISNKTPNTTRNFFINYYLRDVFLEQKTNSNVKHSDLDDDNRVVKKNVGKTTPIRVLKKPTTSVFFNNSHEDMLNFNDLLLFRFNDKVPTITNKPIKPTVYLTFKQKRYNQRTSIGKKSTIFFNKDLNKNQTYSGNPFLKDMSIIEENFGNPTRQYRLLKKAKNRLDTTKVANWNRLLRSRRVLVLPAHVNITVITNSFDIIHSWHIPGLGLKMDCLPGRATHHTLYIDNVGLYYGQCAEICGRYHHHMPIRICALPFEHFLVWWHTFGLPKFLFPANKTSNLAASKYFTRKFSW